MKSITSITLLATLTTYLSSTLAAPTSIPIQGLPMGNISCVTSKESNTWTPSSISSSLQFPSSSAAQTTSTYYSWGVANNPSENPFTSDGPTQIHAVGPNPNIPPQFPSVCNTNTVLYYVDLLDSKHAWTDDVAVYAVGDGVIYYCGVMTDSDNQVVNGFHQCNAA